MSDIVGWGNGVWIDKHVTDGGFTTSKEFNPVSIYSPTCIQGHFAWSFIASNTQTGQ